jgi:hypothetical protein
MGRVNAARCQLIAKDLTSLHGLVAVKPVRSWAVQNWSFHRLLGLPTSLVPIVLYLNILK